jgi:hypothetical protein
MKATPGSDGQHGAGQPTMTSMTATTWRERSMAVRVAVREARHRMDIAHAIV